MKKANTKFSYILLWLNSRIDRLVEHLFPAKTFFVFLTTAMTVAISLVLAFYLRFDFEFPPDEILSLEKVLPIAVILKLVIFYFFHIYSGMWRYVSIYDLVQIFLANLISSFMLFFIVATWQQQYFSGMSRSVIVLDFLICFFAISGKRVLVRILRETAEKSTGKAVRTLIIGSSGQANTLIHAFSMNPGRREIIGILNEGRDSGVSLRGVPVLGNPDEVEKYVADLDISEILLVPPYSNPATIRKILDKFESEGIRNCTLRMLPAYADIADGNFDVSNIKNVEIEDLLGRKPVRLDRRELAQFVKTKKILVTGAGGSIGSELCRQIASYRPDKLVLFDISEHNLYEIDRTLRKSHPNLQIASLIGDVRNSSNVSRAIGENSVEVIFHAAAFKHVPLMEANPLMALDVNVFGTAVIADCAEKHKVRRVVLVSSDKAICPTSVMGASKRLAERTILERSSDTEFVVVRFGNVLDSSGSVIPLFKEQIKEGGPVTVTSKDVVRYFMSIPEAVDLLLQAGVIGKGGDIMVLDMGEPVKIYDMAKKLIELSGFVPYKDIDIKITGMRPGEKEYEELLADEEKVERTPFDRIFVARKETINAPPMDFSLLKEKLDKSDVSAIKALMKKYIPENKFAD